MAGVIAAWVLLQRTSFRWDAYPFILLNLCLSCLAAVQGIILQISANRGDKISAAVALHTEGNTELIKALLDENTALTKTVHENTACLARVQADLSVIRGTVVPGDPGD